MRRVKQPCSYARHSHFYIASSAIWHCSQSTPSTQELQCCYTLHHPSTPASSPRFCHASFTATQHRSTPLPCSCHTLHTAAATPSPWGQHATPSPFRSSVFIFVFTKRGNADTAALLLVLPSSVKDRGVMMVGEKRKWKCGGVVVLVLTLPFFFTYLQF